ncbi:MAG: GntR family transcriptional regulator [Bacteroidaceae bacterium]|jgi:DNA-binding transcriptional regulator YhcF (GntR family)|nr:GntR family transcriptional regulator [Bacteroidaceae bacterium]
MEYSEHKPIYLQNVDLMQEKILQGDWREEERIPSVREMGAMVGVNPNTIVRSYQLLESQEVIYNKRGLGYFVKEGAVARIKENVKNEFIANELPQFKAKAQMLGITKDELVELL